MLFGSVLRGVAGSDPVPAFGRVGARPTRRLHSYQGWQYEDSPMSAESLYPVRPDVAAHTLTDEAAYEALYQQSVVNPDGFWREQAERIDWIKPFSRVKQTSFDDHHVDIKWFADGTLNVSANCLDRHLDERGDQAALSWE